MSTGKILVGVLAGVAIGTAIGIMFAPYSGSKTRRKLMRKGEDYFEGIIDTFNDLAEDVTDKFESLKDIAGDLLDKGKRKTELIRDKAKGNSN